MREKLEAQDWLTTVVEQEAGATTVRVTGAMIDFIKPFEVDAMLEALARPEIRIVSLTVTEGGYYISPATQRFDPTHPDIVYDASNTDAPKTAFGLIVAGLKRRRAAGVAPFTVMSCDNIPGNGHVTENAVAGLAELSDPELAAMDSGEGRLPQLHGRPHHARHHRPRARASFATPTGSRTTGRCSARSSASGWSRTGFRPAGRRWRGRASPSPPTSRPTS